MDEAREHVASEEQHSVPETPEDVAILYSWANMPGAKYRDFSASRRQYRAQQRARIAEQQRQAELHAAEELEAAAQREFDEAERIRKQSRHTDLAQPSGWDDQFRSRELVRRAEEHALRERQEAQRRQRSAETLGVQAQRARSEMLEARQRAEEQAARYAEAAALHEEFHPEAHRAVPGEMSDPYYYTGQVDPAFFASTPGVRTAQATRISTERRTYTYPAHPGSEEHDPGSLQAYRSTTTFAPSPSQTFRPVRSADAESKPQGTEQSRSRSLPQPEAIQEPVYPADDAYYDGKPPAVMKAQEAKILEGAEGLQMDVLIRPVARTPDQGMTDLQVPLSKREDDDVLLSGPVDLPQPAAIHSEERPVLEGTQQRNEQARMSVLETFSRNSEMFLQENGAEPVRTPEVELTPAPARGVDASQDAAVHEVAELPATSVETNTEQLRSRQFPEDSRVRMARHSDQFVRGESRQSPQRAEQSPPSWLEPISEQPQRFLPPSLRPDGEKNLPSTPARKSRFAARYAREMQVPAPSRPERPLRFNRNVDRGKNHAAIVNAFERRRASQNAAQPPRSEYIGRTPGPLAPDTLQQSRERVASQWFALKGLMDHGSDTGESGQMLEMRTPSLCVMSLSGGVGKTSIAATLGRALSSLGEKVLLADTNSHGLLPYYFGARDLRPGTMRTFTPGSGKDAAVQLVKCEIAGVERDEAAQRHVLEDLARRARGSQRLVLDLEPTGAWLARRLVVIHPWVLVPVAPDTNSVVTTQAVERLFAGMTDANGQPVMPYYVLNQYDPSLPLHLDVREVLRRSLGERLLRVTLRRSSAVAEALAQGMTVVDYAPSSPITEDYMHLANWLRHLSASGTGAARGSHWSER